MSKVQEFRMPALRVQDHKGERDRAQKPANLFPAGKKQPGPSNTLSPGHPFFQEDTIMTENAGLMQVNAADIRLVSFDIVGMTPLICHQWSPKAKKEMLAKQTKSAATKKPAKNPQKDYEESLYRTSDGNFGFPAVAFKNAIVRAATSVDGLTMVQARQMFHVMAYDSDLVLIQGNPNMREDMVRLNGKTADIRYRGEFRSWKATLTMRYNAGVVSKQQLLDLLSLAGFSVGVGEWRPERNGSFGTFEVVCNV